MPNLEQTGLLRLDYVDLDESAADDEYWADAHPVLRDDEPAHRVLPCPWHAQQAQPEQPGPGQVELLLHRQRPQVVKRAGRREQGEVGAVMGDVVPVADVGAGCADSPAQTGELGTVHQGDPGGHHR